MQEGVEVVGARYQPYRAGTSQRRARHWALVIAYVGFFIATLGCSSGQYLHSRHATNHNQRLRLAEASGQRPAAGPRQLLVRYLRAGGVYFEWYGRAVMTAPFATNYPLLSFGHRGKRKRQAGFTLLSHGRIAYDRAAIGHVMAGEMNLSQVELLLVGHSHYDHLGDVPVIAQDYARRALIYVNGSGANMLAGEAALRGRLHVIEHQPEWFQAQPGSLIRVHAIASEHAPNLRWLFGNFSWSRGEVDVAWQGPLEGKRLIDMRSGTSHAFLIDFLEPADPARIAFRVHYQDAASQPERGYPRPELIREREVDLAVVTLPGRETLPKRPDQYPVGLLRHTRARHALVVHYEDFFRPILKYEHDSVRLGPSVRGATASRFLDAVVGGIARPEPGPCRMPAAVEGLCADAFNVPLPGEWLLFDAPVSTPPLATARETSVTQPSDSRHQH